jgi:CubicO group peptidase (beta-lactamase class C family)
MLLNKGVGVGTNGKKILSEQSVAEIFKIQTGDAKIGHVPKGFEGWHYGLGVWIKPDATGVFVCPGLTSSYAYINTNKKYAVAILGEPKEKKEKEDKSSSVYREIIEILEGRM